MAEIGRADLVIVPKFDHLSKTVEGELSGVGAAAGKSVGGQMATGVASSLKSSAVTGAVMGVASSLAGAVAGVATRAVSDAFNGYAEHEQLVGGIETLYGDAASKIAEKADAAFETLGVSSNEYMDQTIKYAGSLLKALDGDTVAAAEYADKAIQAQRDNVAKLGTDAQLVENAFVGLTRGNFTMIDNLALGYAGTAQGMADLLNDSGVLADGIIADANNVKDFGFDVMIDAIVATQDRLGITGTAMLEGSETISGSIDRLKASYSNFTAGLMDDTADVGRLTDDLIKSAMTVAGNVAPKVARAVTSIFGAVPDVVSSVFGEASDALSGLADEFSTDDVGGQALEFASSLLEVGENLMSITRRGERAAASTMSFADAARSAAAAAGSIQIDADGLDISGVIDRSTRALDGYISTTRSAQDKLTDLYADSVVAESYERQIEALLDAASALDENGNRVGLNAEQQRQLTAAVEGYNEATGQQWSVTDAVSGVLADEAGSVAATAQEYRELAEAKELASAAGTYRGIADEYAAQQAKAQIAVNEAQAAYNRLLDEATPKVREMLSSYEENGWSGEGFELPDFIKDATGFASIEWGVSQEDIDSYNRLVDASKALSDAQAALDGAAQSGAQALSLYEFMASASAGGTDDVTRRVAGLSPVLIGATDDLGGLSDALRLAGVSSEELAGITDEQLLEVARAYDGTAMSVVSALVDMGAGVSEFGDVTRAQLADIAGGSSIIERANIGDYEFNDLYLDLDRLSEAYAEQEQNAIGFVRAQHEVGAGYTDMGDLVIAALNEASSAGVAFSGLNGDLNEVWASAEVLKGALGEAGVAFEDLNGVDTSAFMAAIAASGGSVDALVASLVQMAEQGGAASESFGAIGDAAAGVDTSSVDALAESYGSVAESASAASEAIGGADTGGATLPVAVELDTSEFDAWLEEHGYKPVDIDPNADPYDAWEGETGTKPVDVETDTGNYDTWEGETGEKPVDAALNTDEYGAWEGETGTKKTGVALNTEEYSTWEGAVGEKPVDADLGTNEYDTWEGETGEKPVDAAFGHGEYDTWEGETGTKPVGVETDTSNFDTWAGETGTKSVGAEIDPELFNEWLAEVGVKKVSVDPQSEYYDLWLAVVDTKHAIANVDTGSFEEWLLQDGRSVPVEADFSTESITNAVEALGNQPGTVPVLVQVDDDSVEGVQTRVTALPGEIVGEPVYVGVEGDYTLYEAQVQILRESGEIATVSATVTATGDPDHPWVVTALDGESYSAFAEINVTANTTDAETALQNVSTAISELPETKTIGIVISPVTDDGELAEIQGVIDASGYDPHIHSSSNVTVEVDADTTEAETKAEALGSTLDAMEAKQTILLFDLDGDGQVLDGTDEMERACSTLSMEPWEITAIMNDEAAQETLEKLQLEVLKLSSSNPTINVQASASGVYSTIAAMQAYLDSQSWYRVLTIESNVVGPTNYSTGNWFAEHAAGAYIVDRSTVVSTAGGKIHVAGEAGAEYVEHAGGATTIVPLTNGSYMRPIAKAISDNMGGAGNVTYNLYVNDAQVNSTPAIQGAMLDFFNVLAQEGAM